MAVPSSIVLKNGHDHQGLHYVTEETKSNVQLLQIAGRTLARLFLLNHFRTLYIIGLRGRCRILSFVVFDHHWQLPRFLTLLCR